MESIEHVRMRSRGGLAQLSDPSLVGTAFPPQFEAVFTWEQVVRVLRKNRLFALVFAGILISGIVGAAYSMRDVYQPVARLEIDPLNSGIKTLQEIEDFRSSDQDYLETQAQILQSNALAIRVIRALHLDRNPEFVASTQSSKTTELKKPGAQAASRAPDAAAFLQEQFDLASRTPEESAALGVFLSRLSVSPVRSSRLIAVSYSSHDPQLAQLITNTLVTQFIDQNYRNRYTSTMQASEWLSTQLNDLRQSVEEANQAVTDYQKKYGLVEVDDRDVPLGQLMNEVNHRLSDAQANRIETEAYIRMIDLGQGSTIPAVRDDQVYQNLMTHYADVRAELAQARTIYGEENSRVKKLQDQANELAAQIEAERDRMVNQVRTSYAAATDRENMMTRAREKLRAQMGDASSHMVAFRVLRNEAVAKAELYNKLQARLKEAGIYAGLRSSNINVVDLAPRLRSPTGPNRRLIIVAGALVSGILALVLAFVRESLDNTVRTPDDIKQWSGVPSVAIVPNMPRDRRPWIRRLLPSAKPVSVETILNGQSVSQIPLTRSHTAEAEAMRDLRAALLFSKSNSPARVILVSSPSAGEGKTTVAINLAMVMALRGKTCLVESDLRRPMIEVALGIDATTGLSQVLTGEASLDASLRDLPHIPDLSILPCGPVIADPAMLMDSDRMQALAIALREKFEYVVIDSPPVIPFSDARVLSSLADVVVLVGRYGVTTHRAMTRCMELLDEVRAPVLGFVLNNIDLNSPDYHYYTYGYSKKMKGRHPYYAEDVLTGPGAPESETINKKGAHA
jgi:capsular exopolysaccharide synthesis family protein